MGAPFLSRYGISAVAGIAGLLGAALWKKPVVAIGTLLLLVGQIGVSALHFASFAYGSVLAEPSSGYNISTSIRDFDERYEWMAAYKDLPIVLLDDLDFLPTAYYAPPSVASRLVYVMMRPGITDVGGTGGARLRACCNSEPPVVEPADFLASNEAFLAYGGPRSFYRLDDFVKAGAKITKEREGGDHFLVLVMYPNASHSQ
jgi:hypothetical protein